MNKPLAIDLFCGLGGWTVGLLAEGYEVIGFDNERHQYGDAKYPAQLVMQDVLTLHGSQFKDAVLIVASPPCQEYSYMAMPWSRAKAIEAEYKSGVRDVRNLTALFDACFRIQKEAIEAAGHFIPLVVENVRGAQKWVGRSRWNYGSFHLWGDVPALMPMTGKVKGSGFNMSIDGKAWNTHSAEFMETHCGVKVGISWSKSGPGNPGKSFQTASIEASGIKAPGMNWSDQTKRGQDFTRLAGKHSGTQGGVKQAGIGGMRENGKGDAWFQDGAAKHGSKSNARKAASAMIAKIPLPLSRHIAAYWKPT